MSKSKGFSLIEILIAVALILIIAAIAIPNLLRARISANEASAVSSLRTINSAMAMFNFGWPSQGYPASLSVLGSTPCHPNANNPCLIDGVLAGGVKSGYNFAASSSGGPPATKYYATAVPISVNQTGINSFCTSEDGAIHADGSGAVAASESACQSLSTVGNQGSASAGGSGGSGGSGGGNGGGNGNGNNGNGNGNGGGSGSGSNGNGNGNGGSGNGNGGGNGNGNNGNGNGNGGGDGSGK